VRAALDLEVRVGVRVDALSRKRCRPGRRNSRASSSDEPCESEAGTSVERLKNVGRRRAAQADLAVVFTVAAASGSQPSPATGALSGAGARNSPRAQASPSEDHVGVDPCTRATSAIDAPGLRVSSRIRSFSSTGYLRRGPVRRPNRSVGSQQPSCPLSSYADTWLRVRLNPWTYNPLVLSAPMAAKTGRLRYKQSIPPTNQGVGSSNLPGAPHHSCLFRSHR